MHICLMDTEGHVLNEQHVAGDQAVIDQFLKKHAMRRLR